MVTLYMLYQKITQSFYLLNKKLKIRMEGHAFRLLKVNQTVTVLALVPPTHVFFRSPLIEMFLK